MASPLAWNEVDPNARKWTDIAWDAFNEDRLTAKVQVSHAVMVSVLDGPCPRCNHRLSQRNLMTLVASLDPLETKGLDAATPQELAEVDFICDCSEEHAGRPKDVHSGCNTAFHLTVYIERS